MILLFGTLFLLLMFGAPVFVAIGLASCLYIIVNDLSIAMIAQRMVSGVDSFALLAVPFFILAGAIMNEARITNRLYNFANSMVAHWRGGLGHVNIYGSVIFSMMSGSALADAAGLGAIQLKEMRERGYDLRFSVGTTGATTVLAALIPPSLALVIYGFVANVSIGRLFIAGILPGLLCALALHFTVFLVARIKNLPSEARQGWPARGRALLVGLPALMTPVIILGSILMGIATPTEAAAAASLYALCLGLAYRSLTLGSIVKVFRETFELTATLMIIVATSMLFGWILVFENVARDFAALLVTFASEPWQLMVILVIGLLVAGMFLDNIAVILLATPIVMPSVLQFGVDPVHFGVVMVLTLMIGLMTPPIGMILFVLARLSGLSFNGVFLACVPFLIPLLVVIGILIAFPQIALVLPNWAFR